MPSRYITALGEEGKYESGSHQRVLQNLLGIRSKREMDRVENEALRATQEHFASVITTETVFSVDLIREMHHHFLGKIYSWAGNIRTVNVSKDGFAWPPPQYLEDALKEFERDCLRKHTPLRPAPIEKIAQSLAEVHADFLMIHPFRDGNGRVARLIATLMALQANEAPPYFGFTGKGSRKQYDRYKKAVGQGYVEIYEPLTRLFEEALGRWDEGLLRESDNNAGF
jgi:cell filamentation protein